MSFKKMPKKAKKEPIQEQIAALVEEVKDNPALSVKNYLYLRWIHEIITDAVKEIKPTLINHLEHYPKSEIQVSDELMLKKYNGRSIWHYDHLEEWKRKKAEIKAHEKELKEIESKYKELGRVAENKLTISNDDGEITPHAYRTYAEDSVKLEKIDKNV